MLIPESGAERGLAPPAPAERATMPRAIAMDASVNLNRRLADICATLEHARIARAQYALAYHMSPTWIWMQVAIVVFVLAGIVIAITKLA